MVTSRSPASTTSPRRRRFAPVRSATRNLSGARPHHEHLCAERDGEHQRDRRRRRRNLGPDLSSNGNQRDPRNEEAAPPDSDRRPRRALPQLAASHEELDRPPAYHAEADRRRGTQDEERR